MKELHDVQIEERLYDAKRGVTVVRLSYEFDPVSGERRTLKGVAFVAPEDRIRQTKREGTYHAIRHACLEGDGTAYDLFDEAILAAVHQGLFAWDKPSYTPGIGDYAFVTD